MILLLSQYQDQNNLMKAGFEMIVKENEKLQNQDQLLLSLLRKVSLYGTKKF
jgi:hypothetical protein